MRVIDLFAGWGGFSLAAEQAGATVRWAANHWPLAVEAHKANHPKAHHVCQDLRQADWSALPAYDVMLASPECRGHSQAAQPARARSGHTRRFHDALRATAWAVVDCAEVTAPRAIIVENVPDFARWRLYPQWCAALEALGYHLASRVLTASRHADVPQRRERLFVVATRRKHRGILDVRATPEPGFRRCIEWRAPARWTRVRDASPAVRARIAKGRRNCGDRFLTQHVTGHPGVPLSQPIRTITTKDQWAIVRGDVYRPLTIRENARGMGFPDSHRLPPGATRRDAICGFGNAVPPGLGRVVVERVGGAL